MGPARGTERRERRLLPTLLVALAIVITLAWVGYQAATDPTPYAHALDELATPATWTRPHDDVADRGFILSYTRVTRFFLVDGDPDGISLDVRRFVAAAGYTVDASFAPGCSRNGPNGPMTCTIAATRDRMHLWIVVFDRGQLVPYLTRGGEPYAGAPDRAVVRISAGDGY